MGITGLIQFIENASTKTNIKNFSGSVVCVDAYSWLHRGVYACSEILVMGGTTDIHIKYCLKYIRLLQHYNIRPILVFDGQHLPAKELTERKRRESRKQAKTRAAELLRLGKKSEARKYFNRCVDVSHKMALELMKECRKLGVDCIVAPYEADAQLAFLNISGIADYVITEDSDLTLFGCKKILFKLDLMGNCVEVDSNKLHLTMGCSLEKYSFHKFRHMCIVSGCDYLDSLPGIGLAKACKFILKTEEDDMNKALDKIPAYLNMRQLEVTPEYKLNFLRANATFLHMFVYDPRIRKMVRLREPSEFNTDIELCCNAGSILDDQTAFQLAVGNLDPFTLKQVDNWNPKLQAKPIVHQNISSIWQCSNSVQHLVAEKKLTQRHLEYKKVTAVEIDEVDDTNAVLEEDILAREDDLLSSYTSNSPPSKKLKVAPSVLADDTLLKVSKRNPFYQPRSNNENSSNLRPLTKTLSPVKKSILNVTKPKPNSLVISKFFTKVDLKIDNKRDDVHESDQREIQQIKDKFLLVKSEYDNKINKAMSLYSNCEKLEDTKCTSSESVENACKNLSEFIQDIVEVSSDEEPEVQETDKDNDQKTINKVLKSYTAQKKKPSWRGSGLKRVKPSVPSNQPSLTQFIFAKKSVT